MRSKTHKDLFSKKIEFIGSIFDEKIKIDNVHFEIFYSLINSHEIWGSVIGSSKIFNEMSELMNSKSMFLNLEAFFENEKISSKMVSLNNLSGFQSSRDKGALMEYEVSNLNLYELEIDHQIKTESKENIRIITFLLDGPGSVWNVREFKTYKYDGNIENKVKKFDITLSEDIKISVYLRYFYHNYNSEKETDIFTKKYALEFETNLSIDQLSGEEFLEFSKKKCEDLLLLASFLSKSWIIWYGYYYKSSSLFREYFRVTRDVDSIKIGRDKFPINFENITAFLEKGISVLSKLRSINFDITLPLTYYIIGHKGKYMEEKFSLFFLSLEKIKDLYLIKNKLSKNISVSKFKKLRSQINNYIKSEKNSDLEKNNILSKLPELNRPPLKYVLEHVFKTYGIKWQDLYPNNSSFTLINTRDHLFHSSSTIESEFLFKELTRLEILLDRLFLKLLGWDDISKVKKRYHERWLVQN